MTTPEQSGAENGPGKPDDGAGKKTLILAAAFVLVAGVAGTGGALIANSGSGDSSSTSSTAGTGSETAETVITSFASGENRGFGDVHQGRDETERMS